MTVTLFFKVALKLTKLSRFSRIAETLGLIKQALSGGTQKRCNSHYARAQSQLRELYLGLGKGPMSVEGGLGNG